MPVRTLTSMSVVLRSSVSVDESIFFVLVRIVGAVLWGAGIWAHVCLRGNTGR